MSAAKKCLCCNDTRIVADADGKPRPCSRCCTDEFMAWADSRRPTPQPPVQMEDHDPRVKQER